MGRTLRRIVGEIGILKMLGEMGAFVLFMFAMWALLVLGYALDQSRPRCAVPQADPRGTTAAVTGAAQTCEIGGQHAR